jgi:hypothetical protein
MECINVLLKVTFISVLPRRRYVRRKLTLSRRTFLIYLVLLITLWRSLPLFHILNNIREL